LSIMILSVSKRGELIILSLTAINALLLGLVGLGWWLLNGVAIANSDLAMKARTKY